jgi:hypothetical protein
MRRKGRERCRIVGFELGERIPIALRRQAFRLRAAQRLKG